VKYFRAKEGMDLKSNTFISRQFSTGLKTNIDHSLASPAHLSGDGTAKEEMNKKMGFRSEIYKAVEK
jgi:hypothetical protein